MTCKNILLGLATMLSALASSLALGTTQQQNLEPGQWHPALDSDGKQAIDPPVLHSQLIHNSTRPMSDDEHPSEPRLPPP
jgi:hypothetical protein